MSEIDTFVSSTVNFNIISFECFLSLESIEQFDNEIDSLFKIMVSPCQVGRHPSWDSQPASPECHHPCPATRGVSAWLLWAWQACQLCPSRQLNLRICVCHHGHTVDGNAKSNYFQPIHTQVSEVQNLHAERTSSGLASQCGGHVSAHQFPHPSWSSSNGWRNSDEDHSP